MVEHGGKEAVTHYAVEQSFHGIASLVTCTLETGRTHQIRVHMTHMGHGLIGDTVYGQPPRGIKKHVPDAARAELLAFGRQALHARAIRFIHPVSGEELSFEAPLPEDMQNLLKNLKNL